MVFGLGGLNLFGVIVLGTMLKYVCIRQYTLISIMSSIPIEHLWLHISLKECCRQAEWIDNICFWHISFTSGGCCCFPNTSAVYNSAPTSPAFSQSGIRICILKLRMLESYQNKRNFHLSYINPHKVFNCQEIGAGRLFLVNWSKKRKENYFSACVILIKEICEKVKKQLCNLIRN